MYAYVYIYTNMYIHIHTNVSYMREYISICIVCVLDPFDVSHVCIQLCVLTAVYSFVLFAFGRRTSTKMIFKRFLMSKFACLVFGDI